MRRWWYVFRDLERTRYWRGPFVAAFVAARIVRATNRSTR